MAEEPDIVMFRTPLCGRCKQVAANLAQVKKLRPDIRVQIYTLPDHIQEATRLGVLNLPLLAIRGKPFGGILSTEQILAALDAPK